ncbi:unnamed protein product [Effrenium voratum]|nr:unnamed protein product [Effrenium voratum]
MNTPETVAPRQKQGAPPDCYGPEASALTKKLLPPGTKVRLELDEEQVDKYGRQLVYLYRSQDQLFINAELLRQGAARRYRVPPNVKNDPAFVQLEKRCKGWQQRPLGRLLLERRQCRAEGPAGEENLQGFRELRRGEGVV